MSEVLQELKHENCKIRILVDTDPISPREWDNLGKMVCWHRKYLLGDEQPSQSISPREYRQRLVSKAWPNAENWPDEKLDNYFDRHYIGLDLYVYEHGGITMSASPFSCPWDSGQVGFIYVSVREARKQLRSNYSRKTVEEILRGEVEIYDAYLTGEVVGYEVTGQNGELIDSCWGFYPSGQLSDRYDYIIAEARQAAERVPFRNGTGRESI
jgi:hypothetical protein